MKKILTFLLVIGLLLSLIFCFAGCREVDGGAAQENNTTAATESNSTQDGFGGLIDGSIELPAV